MMMSAIRDRGGVDAPPCDAGQVALSLHAAAGATAAAVTTATAQANVCWFCRRGRHGDCMVKIPVADSTEGPHDCSFDTAAVRCACCDGMHNNMDAGGRGGGG